MQAVTDFAATREHIEYAISVFRDGFIDLTAKEEQARQDWVANKVRKDWFRRSAEYWNRYSRGEVGDAFVAYEMKRLFKHENQGWYEDKLEKAVNLLKKFDCAVDNCEAIEVKLSDSDLELLSISLQSALES